MSVWVELFYDLVFVAAILVLSAAASHLEDGVRVARIVAVFIGLWSVWLATTFFANRYRVQDMTHRLLVLAQMFIVVLVAMEAHAGIRQDAVYLSLHLRWARGDGGGDVHARRAHQSHRPGRRAPAGAGGVDLGGHLSRRDGGAVADLHCRLVRRLRGSARVDARRYPDDRRPVPASTRTTSSSAWARSRSSCAVKRS